MQPAVDPFHPLLRVLDRYRRDVHQLNGPPSGETLAAAEAHLGRPIPPTLCAFLQRWNGATLFRGALRLRSAAELAPVSTAFPDVVIFADGPGENVHWAWAPDGNGSTLFGLWTPPSAHGGGFDPLHERFDRWLMATIRILDEDLRSPDEQLSARLDCDPHCGLLLLKEAERVLAGGDPDRATEILRRATAADPGVVAAWERLGDTRMGVDNQEARWAYLKALRAVRLPAPYPSPLAPGAGLIRTLSRLFPPGDDAWERELVWFLREAVRDVCSSRELEMVEQAAVSLAHLRLARNERASAREALVEFTENARAFTRSGPCVEAELMLASIEIDLGHHDEAERRLRVTRLMPPEVQGRADLLLGRIAVVRQEPWAEEILRSALERLDDPALCCEAMLLLGERALLQDQPTEANEAFNEASRLASEAGDHRLGARSALGLGDLLRREGEGPAAELCYREAWEQADGDPEIRLRVVIRWGDLARMTGDDERAAAHYRRAVEGFHALGLPIREAWARLRLAQLGELHEAKAAQLIFKEADMAAGVAASDAIAGDPAASLEWHMERTAAHARERVNAERARPPLTRADADRPERRIGAHRTAIAACNRRVVEALAEHLDACAHNLDLATPRLTDPHLTRYVALADLLAAHRSYEAAQVLLRHLFQVKLGGYAGRALVGAIARSSNAALVSGLLEAVEGSIDPSHAAAAAEVLGWRRERAAVAPLRKLVGEENLPKSVRRAAITALGRIADPVVVPDLLPALDLPELAEEASVALLLLGEWRGVDAQAQALASARPGLSRSTGAIVGRYGGPSYLLLLYRTSEMDGPAGLGALQGLGYLGDPRAIPLLIDATTGRDPQRARVANAALELLTGHHEDLNDSLLRNRWMSWWEENGPRFTAARRYRHGRPMDPGLLVDRLSHDDARVRRETYDELVISTGVRLPFDAEGPYRVQLNHLAAWRRWWAEHADRFPAGRWTFHGADVG